MRGYDALHTFLEQMKTERDQSRTVFEVGNVRNQTIDDAQSYVGRFVTEEAEVICRRVLYRWWNILVDVL